MLSRSHALMLSCSHALSVPASGMAMPHDSGKPALDPGGNQRIALAKGRPREAQEPAKSRPRDSQEPAKSRPTDHAALWPTSTAGARLCPASNGLLQDEPHQVPIRRTDFTSMLASARTDFTWQGKERVGIRGKGSTRCFPRSSSQIAKYAQYAQYAQHAQHAQYAQYAQDALTFARKVQFGRVQSAPGPGLCL